MKTTLKRIVKTATAVFLSLAVILTNSPAIPIHTSGGTTQSDINRLTELAERIARENQQREQQLADLRDDMARQNEFIAVANEQIEQIEAQIAAYEQLINAKQANIDELQVQIDEKQVEIQNTENRIAQQEQYIEQLEGDNKDNIEKFGQVIAQMYMNTGSDTISLLTGSTSFYDVLVRTEMIRNINDTNIRLMNEILATIARQEEAIAALQSDIALHLEQKSALDAQQLILETEKETLAAQQAIVSAEAVRQHNALRALTSQRAELQERINRIRGQYNASEAELAEIDRQITAFIRAEEERRRRENQPPPTDYSADGFIWPVPSQYRLVTSRFGWRALFNSQHNGWDIGNSGINGAPIYAMRSGVVTRASALSTYGNCVMIDHGGGYVTVYAHLSGYNVSNGQQVRQGDVIGYVGNTGRSTGPHLHFEIRVNGSAVDPARFFPGY